MRRTQEGEHEHDIDYCSDVETRSESYFNGLDRLEPRWPEIKSEVDEYPYSGWLQRSTTQEEKI